MTTQIDESSKAVGLGYKNLAQLIKLSDEFQPVVYFKESVFCKVVEIAEQFCTYRLCPLNREPEIRFNDLFLKKWEAMRGKYYPYGIKRNNGKVTKSLSDVMEASKRIKTEAHGVAYMRIVRACRDFLRGGGTDTITLYNRLLTIRAMYKPV